MPHHHFSFHNACALITGASSGLGAEFARQLASDASDLILVARRGDRLKILAEELITLNPTLRIHLQVVDLSSAREREKLAAWIIEQKLPLNLLINNAGLGDLGEFSDGAWNRLEGILNINITALTHLTHLLLPTLRKNSPSAILNVGSITGFFSMPTYAVYAASKAYVRSFSEALQVEEERHGLIVALLCPGPIPTEFLEVASREREKVSVAERAPTLLITSTKKVVATALHGLALNRTRISPNHLLQGTIMLMRLLPFFVQKKILKTLFRRKNKNLN